MERGPEDQVTEVKQNYVFPSIQSCFEVLVQDIMTAQLHTWLIDYKVSKIRQDYVLPSTQSCFEVLVQDIMIVQL